LSTVAFIALGVQGLLPPWLAVTVVSKDIYVVIGAGILHFSGNLSIVKPSYLGKLSTLLQILVVGLALCAVLTPIDRTLLNIFHIITGIVTILACLEYIWGGIQIFVNYSDREEG
jgi:cardiolipin synthase